jgi:hypothetical protein
VSRLDVVPLDAPQLAGNRKPPYAKEVLERVARGETPNVYVFTGDAAWDRAEARRHRFGSGTALVLPKESDPAWFCWPALDAEVVDARTLTRQKAIELGTVLIACGTRFVAMSAAGDEPLSFWRKSARTS